MTRPPFPKAIDGTLRSTFVACPRKFELMYLHHWKPQQESIHLIAGGALARGLEVARKAFFINGSPPSEAVAEGCLALIAYWGGFEPHDMETKTLDRMVSLLDLYFTHYGFETDQIQPHFIHGKPAIEFDFAVPIEIDLRHPETGDPLLYTGRFDMLGDFQSSVWAVDEKTTGQLGKSWYKNWNLRSQFTGYVWASQEYDIDCQGAIVRGLCIRKTDFDFAESIQQRPRWFVERWHAQLVRDCERMIEMWQNGYFDYNLDNACTDYGSCTFQEICTSRHPERWLNANFVQKIWDPLTKTETEVVGEVRPTPPPRRESNE